MKWANFPVLIPAFTAQIPLHDTFTISADLLVAPYLPASGLLVSEPSYPYTLRAEFLHGSDFSRRDCDGRHRSIDVRSVARDKRSGALLAVSFTGSVDTGEAGGGLAADSNASLTGFGNVSLVIQARFETQDQRLKDIEKKLYVGLGRFIVHENEPSIVEYKISEVASVHHY